MDIMKWECPAPSDLMDAFDSKREEMEKTMNVFRQPEAAGFFDRTTAPAVDVVERDDSYLVVADLPGVDRKDLEVSITGSVLSIRGNKKEEAEPEKKKIFRKETWVGAFRRTINLPDDVDAEKVKADLKDGVLKVTATKREEAKPRVLSITVK